MSVSAQSFQTNSLPALLELNPQHTNSAFRCSCRDHQLPFRTADEVRQTCHCKMGHHCKKASLLNRLCCYALSACSFLLPEQYFKPREQTKGTDGAMVSHISMKSPQHATRPVSWLMRIQPSERERERAESRDVWLAISGGSRGRVDSRQQREGIEKPLRRVMMII